MPDHERHELASRITGDYLVQSRNYRVSETYADRDRRYEEVDKLLRGEWGYTLPGDNAVVEDPMVMNLGHAFTQDVSRLTAEQTPVFRAPVYGDGQQDYKNAVLRETVAQTIWHANRGDLLVPQWAIDLTVCGAAYTVCWLDDSDYPRFTRVDPRHCYPTIQNGEMIDLLVVHVFPAAVADQMFPGRDILVTSRDKGLKNDVEIWEYYTKGYATRWVAYKDKSDQFDPSRSVMLNETYYDIDCVPATYTQIPSHDGAIRGMLDQIGASLQAKNKIASLMVKYTEHQVFAPWESKGILNDTATPGPNTVYRHDPNAPGETFMRRVSPAGSNPGLFALMNLLDLDQRGAIGYPASRQGEVSTSIASAAFVESTQGQLSSVVKSIQAHEADMRSQTLEVLLELDVAHRDFEKPLFKSVDKKTTYVPSRDVGHRTKIFVTYGAGAGMSRQNADTRILNLLGARLIDRGTARDNIEFLRDRTDIQDKIEMENAEDALQQLFWPDPTVPIDVKFRVKSLMQKKGYSLTDAWEEVQAELAAEAEAQAQVQAELAAQQEAAVPAAPVEGGEVVPEAATEQAVALEKGQRVTEPADIELPRAPMEQIFIGG